MRPQLIVIGALILSLVAVSIRYAVGQAEGIAPLINIAWVLYDLAVFSIIIRAALYSPDKHPELKES